MSEASLSTAGAKPMHASPARPVPPLSPEQATDRLGSPRPSLGACFEVLGPWLLCALAAWALLAALLHGLQHSEARLLREARLQIALQDLRDRLETDLALGFELAVSGRGQALLEELIGSDGSLVAAEVFDGQGVSLFNTDRGAIGERVPDAWRLAAARVHAASGRAWSVQGLDGLTLGLPVRGPFGELVGHVCLTTAAVPGVQRGTLVMGVLATTVLLAALAVWVARRVLKAVAQRRAPQVEDAALARLLAAQTRHANALAALTQADSDR